MVNDLQRVVDLLDAMTAPANNSAAFQGGWDACRAEARKTILEWARPAPPAKSRGSKGSDYASSR
jgi:hypothetical protein